MTYTKKRGDTDPLVAQLLHEGVPQNLTGASVRLIVVDEAGATVIDAPVTVTDAAQGWTSYAWQPADHDLALGEFPMEWEAVLPGGVVRTFPSEGTETLVIEADLDGPQAPDESGTGTCWPVDTSCCDDFGDYPASVQRRAKMLAGQTMQMLTAGRVGGCAVTVRPCSARARCDVGVWYGQHGFLPVNWAGTWFNCTGCGTDSCGCTEVPSVRLPGPIGRVDEVVVFGQVLAPSAYRVHNGNLLVRVDGQAWPLCQDLTDPDDTFSVTYLRGAQVDDTGAWAAGLLACEYAKACTTGKCRLPAGVTSVVRQGVTMTIASGAFPDGLTGIREVDSFVAYWNPFQRKATSTVWSPDIRRPLIES